MKTFRIICGTIFGITSITSFAPASLARSGCYPSNAVANYKTYLNGGASPQQAINLSIQENHDVSESCRWRINSAFKNSGLGMPFPRTEQSTRRLNSHSEHAGCNEKVDAIFYRRYPELRGKKLNNMNGPLAREWMEIQNSIC